MFQLLPELLSKLRVAEEASLAQARALRELIDFLQKLVPNDFRERPMDIYRNRG